MSFSFSSSALFSTIKDSISSAKNSVTSTISERGDSSERKNAAAKAKEYEEKRALEEKEKLIARREYKQMKSREDDGKKNINARENNYLMETRGASRQFSVSDLRAGS